MEKFIAYLILKNKWSRGIFLTFVLFALLLNLFEFLKFPDSTSTILALMISALTTFLIVKFDLARVLNHQINLKPTRVDKELGKLSNNPVKLAVILIAIPTITIIIAVSIFVIMAKLRVN